MTQTLPADAPHPSESGDRLVHLLAAALGTLLVLNAVLSLCFSLSYIRTHRDLTYPEGSVVGGAVAAATGSPVYADWREWPHRFAPYGPALYYPVAWIARAAGAADWPLYDLRYYTIGRYISISSVLGISIICMLMLRRAGLGWRAAVACGFGLLPLWPQVIGYVISYRPDAPLVMWNMAAVCAAVHGLRRPGMRWLTIGCLWMALGYKSTGWAAPLVVVWLAWRELGPRGALAWGGMYVAGALAMVAGMQYASDGLYVLNTLISQTNGTKFPFFVDVWMDSKFSTSWDLMLRFALTLPLAVWFWRYPGSNPAVRPLGMYAALSLVICWAQTAKVGSDINYLLEPWALGGVLTGLAWQRWGPARQKPAGSRQVVARAALIAIAALVVAYPLHLTLSASLAELPSWRSLGSRVYPENLMMGYRGPILLLDAALTHPDPEAHAIPDPIIYNLMIDDGRLSPDPLIERLRRHQYEVIGLSATAREHFFNWAVDQRAVTALQQYYRETGGDWRLQIWKPRAGSGPAPQ